MMEKSHYSQGPSGRQDQDFERDGSFNEDDEFENRSDTSVKTHSGAVVLWDMLKGKFRKCEQDELERVIGRQLISNGEDLREEYDNFYEIYQETLMRKSKAKALQEIQDNLKQKQSNLFSTGGNQQFLNKELSFFISNLQQKAVESGLDEDSLIPRKNEKEKQIFEYIRENMIEPGDNSRPQSAMTGLSSSSKVTDRFAKNQDPAGIDETMRGSFYSTTNGGFYKNKAGIVDSLQVNNVLELSSEDMIKIQQIRDFMQEQQDGLRQEIDEMQKILLGPRASEKPKQTLVVAPSQKDLKDYSTRLQDEFLKSDQIIKQQKALNLPDTHKKFIPNDQITSLPIPSKGIGSQQESATIKPLRKLTSLGPSASKGAIKVINPKNIDTESPLKDEGAKQIVKIKMKRGDSQSKLVKIRSSSKTALTNQNSVTAFDPKPQKLKLKLKESKKKETKQNQELYGLDIDFLESMGFGDIINGINSQSPVKQESSNQENMSIDDLRQKYDIGNSKTAVGKLRGVCKEYNQIYQNYDENVDDL